MAKLDLMSLSLYDFDLDDSLIARFPAEPRDSSKLLSFSLKSDEIFETVFRDIGDYLPENSVIVFNETKVIPARVMLDIGKEIFYLDNVDSSTFIALVKPGKYFKVGRQINHQDFVLEVVEVLENGNRVIKVLDGCVDDFLSKCGITPLPPYMKHKLEDAIRLSGNYQTVFAKDGKSVAAPTAGLHFTDELISRLENQGHKILKVNLNIGYGTFKPIDVEDILEHKMHSENYQVTAEVAKLLNQSRLDQRKIIAVGTTTLRCLQSCYNFELQKFMSGESSTDIFIYPGYDNFVVNGLITNFHLPKSSLMLLVSAFIGYENVMKIYRHAINMRYRFYSFGDACLFLRD